MDINEILRASRFFYDLHSENEWEKTAFFENTGGFVVTSLQGIQRGEISKQEKKKYLKEREMCLRYASYGFRIEHLSEKPGISSPDVNVEGRPGGLIRIIGELAKLKSLSSSNNIQKRARYAINHQHAEIILFEFTKYSNKIENILRDLSKKGIHGFYYYLDKDGYSSF